MFSPFHRALYGPDSRIRPGRAPVSSDAASSRVASFVILALAGFLTIPAGASPQELAEPDTAEIELEELIVTAHRVPVERDRVAQSTTVLTGEELEARGIHRLSQGLQGVPGLSVVQSGSFGATTSLFTRGGESDYTKVLVDGIPLNRPGGAFDAAHLSTANIDRVEVVRGPTSVIHGSDAMTGVIQILTGGQDGPPTARGGFSAGSYGTLRWDASLAGGGELADYSFSVSRFDTDGLLELNNDYGNTVASGRVDLTPTGSFSAGVTLRFADNAFHFPTNSAGEPVDENAVSRNESVALGLDLGYAVTPHVDAEIRVQTHQLSSATDDRPDGPADTTGFFAFESQEDVDRWSTDARVNYRPVDGTVVTVGGSFENQSRDSFNRSQSASGASQGSLDVSRDNMVVYAEGLTELGPVSLSVGGRVDDNEQFGTYETFRAGAVWELPTRTRIRGNLGTGFKEPTFLENFSQGFVTGNPDLDPEQSWSLEFGLEQPVLEGALTLSATYFDQRFKDLIQFTFQPPTPGDPNFFNVAKASSGGVETVLTVRPFDRLEVDASYTFTDTEVLDAGFDQGPESAFPEGKKLLRRPTHQASIDARMSAGDGRFTVGMDWVGERADRDFSTFPSTRITLDPYATLDLSAEWTILEMGNHSRGITPTVRVENLLDDHFETVANFPTPGRTVFVGVRSGLRF